MDLSESWACKQDKIKSQDQQTMTLEFKSNSIREESASWEPQIGTLESDLASWELKIRFLDSKLAFSKDNLV